VVKTCPHLQPIADALEQRGIALEPIASPYADDWAWHACDCTFDADALRRRLGLDGGVEYIEYDGRVAGSDATFGCKRCRCVIMGLHPRYAPARARRLA